MNWYEEQFRLSQHRRYSASSEHTHLEQLSLLFNEVKATAAPKELELTIETITYKRRKAQGKREVTLENLPGEITEHVRYIYSCRHCERKEIKTPIEIAPMPAPVIPKSLHYN